MRKSTRTISGVTPVAVMTLPMPCPGQCVYCPTYSSTPQSYTPESPAVMRARQCDYRAPEQVKLRLKILSDMGHPTDKVELIIMGGTFLSCPVDYQYQFVKGCFDALNGTESTTLEEAKRLNETASHRCTGLCIETRPDWCREEEINRMLEFGTTRVELGVQTLSDDIYRLVRRGHTVADVVSATRLLKEHGFKVHYHWMPGLPGATPEEDFERSRQLFSDARFKPDGLKLYPTMVIAGTELEKWYQAGRYHPYDKETMINLVAKIKAAVPRYLRISRVLRDIPAQFIVAGLKDSLRDVVKKRMAEDGTACQCIRCREYGHRARSGWKTGDPQLVRMDYEASDAREIFLSFEDAQATLFGLLRLRIQARPIVALQPEPAGSNYQPVAEPGKNIALIRELHVYGPEAPLYRQYPAEPLPQDGDNLHVPQVQHRGIGKALIKEAERIARTEFQANRIAVLSGVGAREYYRSEFNYQSQADYMVKQI